jgi:hypothetical protein
MASGMELFWTCPKLGSSSDTFRLRIEIDQLMTECGWFPQEQKKQLG